MGRTLPGDLLVAVVIALTPAEVVVVGPLREHRPVSVVIVSGHLTSVPFRGAPGMRRGPPPSGDGPRCRWDLDGLLSAS